MSKIDMPASWPHDENGKPMAIVIGTAADLVPTVQYGNVTIGPVSVMRPVSNGSDEELINDMRLVQRMAEYAVGVEHRLANWAIHPETKMLNPITAEDAFASPPTSYDPSSMPPHPADAANGVVKS